ncbi:phosphate-starvation-inducible PsiE family protein [Chryseolinea sp. T2]|uniref:phosphate-starvation-inducible PsiE family protein n=1 Tax=Chryseolinea sp. T2 TaxID=3129255 RepID=UPI003076A05D
MDKGFEHVIGRIEKVISYTLISVGLLFAVYQSIELVYLVFKNLYNSLVAGEFFVGQHGMPIAGLFFNILLLLEVLETVKTFSKGHIIKIKIILIVGIIAVTRKLLMADMTHAEPMEEIAVGIVILALAIGYFLVSKAASVEGKDSSSNAE